MSRSSRITSFQKNRIKNGFGQGVGIDYKPFIQAHDNKVPSEGWLTRHEGWKTGRIHHTLSEHERRYLYFLEWQDNVVDIREQFPLLPLEKTTEIAEQIGIRHAHVDSEPVVMTTDFLITITTSKGRIDIVRTVKPASKLDNRTIELFEIERRYFSEQGIDWGIILDNGLPNKLIKNVEEIHEGRYLETRPGIDTELVNLVSAPLLQLITNNYNKEGISKICLKNDDILGLKPGTSMFILKHMLATKRWGMDMNKLMKDSEPLEITILNQGNSDISYNLS